MLCSSSLYYAVLSDLINSHKPDLFCLTETWIPPITTSSELLNCTTPNYILVGILRKHSENSSSFGGFTRFLIRETFTQFPTSLPDFSSFESSFITLSHARLSLFNVYRPPSSSALSKPHTVLLIPQITSPLIFCLSAFNFTQHANFPTHNKNCIHHLVTTSSNSLLASSLSPIRSFPSLYQTLYKPNTTHFSNISLFPPIPLFTCWLFTQM